jgi:hypothetical protein
MSGAMGQGRSQGMGSVSMPQQPTQNLTKDDKPALLKQQAEAMN